MVAPIAWLGGSHRMAWWLPSTRPCAACPALLALWLSPHRPERDELRRSQRSIPCYGMGMSAPSESNSMSVRCVRRRTTRVALPENHSRRNVGMASAPALLQGATTTQAKIYNKLVLSKNDDEAETRVLPGINKAKREAPNLKSLGCG